MQGRELIETNMLAMINEEFKDQEIRIVIREILRECMKGGKLLFVKIIKIMIANKYTIIKII